MALRAFILLPLLAYQVLANVEKTIFIGPPLVNIPSAHPTLDDLRLDVLNPDDHWSVRTHVAAGLPGKGGDISAGGIKETWLLLDNLAEGRRYEVRICWAATQPTDFDLQTYELQTVWETPELISSLSEYSYSRQPSEADEGDDAISSSPHGGGVTEWSASALFLRVRAAASYFTTNRTLMERPPPVHVDIILDPYVLGGVLPRSLAPTVLYVLAVAGVSWFVARRILRWLRAVAGDGEDDSGGSGSSSSKASGDEKNKENKVKDKKKKKKKVQ